MRTGSQVCGPDELKVLQQIFDSVWLDLVKDGKVHENDEVARRRVSAQMFKFVDGDIMDVEAIKSAVLKSLQSPKFS